MYSCQNWNLTVAQFGKFDFAYRNLLSGGFTRIRDNDGDFQNKLNNEKVHVICCTADVCNFIQKQQKDYVGHVVRMPNEHRE